MVGQHYQGADFIINNINCKPKEKSLGLFLSSFEKTS
nr:MAG TPA: hypothetical protein [Caudoviricetes sp.]